MKPIAPLIAAAALSLSAWPLHAQDAAPERPQNPPSRDGAPPRGHPLAGLFQTLDSNQDGAIDTQEVTQAVEKFGKFDRDGDGRITREEMRPAGEGQRAPEGGPRPPQREPGPQADGARHPQGSDRDRKHDGPPPARRGEGEARREGPQGPPPGESPQARDRGPRHGPPPSGGERPAQRDQRPEFGRGDGRPAGEGPMRRGDDRMAMGPRPDERRGPAPREFRDEPNARDPQCPSGQMRPPQPPDGERRGPAPMHQPHFDGPPRGSQPQVRGDLGRPDGRPDERAERGPRPPRGDRDSRPQNPDQRDFQ